MRTKPARRGHTNREHNQYGIYNWFKNHKGVTNQQIIMECVASFCIKNGFIVNAKTNEGTMLNFAGNRFQSFATFAGAFLVENNYLPKTIQ